MPFQKLPACRWVTGLESGLMGAFVCRKRRFCCSAAHASLDSSLFYIHLQAPIAALHGGRLVCLAPSAPGGSRLDAARSIDLLAARESVSFLSCMRPEVAAATKELEAWLAHQQHGLDLAAAGGEMSTEKLLKVCRDGGIWSYLLRPPWLSIQGAWLLLPWYSLHTSACYGTDCLCCPPAAPGHGCAVPVQEPAACHRYPVCTAARGMYHAAGEEQKRRVEWCVCCQVCRCFLIHQAALQLQLMHIPPDQHAGGAQSQGGSPH